MKFIEVCAGCGGLSSGFMKAGWEPLYLCDFDKWCVESLKLNHPNTPAEKKDMRELDVTQYKGQVDCLMGGVPCQAFSLAGMRQGLEDPRGQLIVEFNRLINECKPKMFIVENVKGLVIHEGGETIRDVVELFKNHGLYKVQYQVLKAVEYNVPQKRERVFIVGVRSDVGRDFEYPDVVTEIPLTIRQALTDVPDSACASYPQRKREIMEHVPPGGCWVDLPEDLKVEYMGNSMNSGGGKRGMARRLHMDEPSLTLTTSPAQKQTERCHPTETRPLSVREYARIQTFSDDYKFAGSSAAQYKQIGNAVPVELAYHVALQASALLTE